MLKETLEPVPLGHAAWVDEEINVISVTLSPSHGPVFTESPTSLTFASSPKLMTAISLLYSQTIPLHSY